MIELMGYEKGSHVGDITLSHDETSEYSHHILVKVELETLKNRMISRLVCGV